MNHRRSSKYGPHRDKRKAMRQGLIASQSQLLADMTKRLEQQEASHRQKLHKAMIQHDNKTRQLEKEHRRQLQETGADDLRGRIRRLEKDNASLRMQNEQLEASLSKSLTVEAELKHERERADKAEASRESDLQAHRKLRNKLYDQVYTLFKTLNEVAPAHATIWEWGEKQQEKQLDEAIGRGASAGSGSSRP
ncbi:unnamed protein product [Symbiodinium sp. CCMP2592]|nr:unnamed protein product [Symbiodinium sp. CCMP2592]